jgi:hypothetical protein
VSPLARAIALELIQLLRSDPELRTDVRRALDVDGDVDELLTISAAATVASVSPRTIARWIADGLPASGSHKSTRVRRRDLERWLTRGGVKPRTGLSPEQLADSEEVGR